MNRLNIHLTLLILVLCSAAYPQSYRLRGYVQQAQGQAPVPYATLNIGYTSLGTVADSRGYFLLQVPAQYADSQLRVSALGHRTRAFAIRSLLSGDSLLLKLQTEEVYLEAVPIIPPEQIFKKAFQNHAWYDSLDFRVRMYYRGWETRQQQGDTTFAAEAIVDHDYRYGYEQALGSRWLVQKRRLDTQKRSPYLENWIFNKAMPIQDEVFFRCDLNKPRCMRRLEVRFVKHSLFQGQKVFVIRYKWLKPTLNLTGIYPPLLDSISGRLYVQDTTFVILRHERSIYFRLPDSARLKLSTSAEYPHRYAQSTHNVWNYRPYQGKYYLASEEHTVRSLERLPGQPITHYEARHVLIALWIKSGIADVHHDHKRYAYLNEVPENPEFWRKFHATMGKEW